jgi:hypothetical protein
LLLRGWLLGRRNPASLNLGLLLLLRWWLLGRRNPASLNLRWWLLLRRLRRRWNLTAFYLRLLLRRLLLWGRSSALLDLTSSRSTELRTSGGLRSDLRSGGWLAGCLLDAWGLRARGDARGTHEASLLLLLRRRALLNLSYGRRFDGPAGIVAQLGLLPRERHRRRRRSGPRDNAPVQHGGRGSRGNGCAATEYCGAFRRHGSALRNLNPREIRGRHTYCG